MLIFMIFIKQKLIYLRIKFLNFLKFFSFIEQKKIKQISIKFIKYWIWWTIWAFVDLYFYRYFSEILKIYYLFALIFSFCISFFVWFFFQKYITFEDNKIFFLKQWTKFLIFQLIWLWINIVLMYFFVDVLWFYHLYVAFFNKWIIFLWNFSMNYFFNFNK